MKLLLSMGLMLITSTSIMANEVTMDDWIKGMTTALPDHFCKAEQYFRQCFTVTQSECEKVALSTTKECLAKNKDKIPARLRQPEDGTRWGSVVGACAGEAYEIALQKKLINSSRCKDPNNWR
jgi:hypothetical protein